MWIGIDRQRWAALAKRLQTLDEPLRSYVRDVLQTHEVQEVATQYAARNMDLQIVVHGVHFCKQQAIAFVADRCLSEQSWLMQLDYDVNRNDWVVSNDRLIIPHWTATAASQLERVRIRGALQALRGKPAPHRQRRPKRRNRQHPSGNKRVTRKPPGRSH